MKRLLSFVVGVVGGAVIGLLIWMHAFPSTSDDDDDHECGWACHDHLGGRE